MGEYFALEDGQEEDGAHEGVQPEVPQHSLNEGENEPQQPINEDGDEPQQPVVEGGNPQSDDVNLELAGTLGRTMDGGDRGADAQGNDGEKFDNLDYFKKMMMEEGANRSGNSRQESTGGQPETEQEENGHAQDGATEAVRQKVEKLRRGKLYMAVVLARELESGKKNPIAGGRIMRFLKSSAFDMVANGAKAAGAANKIAGTYFDSYKDSAISMGIKLVSDMIGFVAAIKSFSQKMEKFCEAKGALDNIVGIIGIVSDFALMMSKGFGIAQAIVKFLHKDNTCFKKVMEYVNRALSGVTQLGTIITDIKGLTAANKEIDSLNAEEGQKWQTIERSIFPNYRGQAQDSGTEEEEQPAREAQGEQPGQEPREGQPAREPQEGQPGQEAQPGQPARAPGRAERKERRRRVIEFLRHTNVEEEDKDQLVSYLVVCMKLDKTKSLVVSKASSLIGFSIGLAANITYGAKYIGIKNTEKTGKYLDKAADVGVVAVSATKIGVDAANSKRQNNEEAKAIKERLWGLIEELGEPQYGLKGVSQSLENPSAGVKGVADTVVSKYEAARERLREAYVDYDFLLKAKDIEDFKKLLLAGI